MVMSTVAACVCNTMAAEAQIIDTTLWFANDEVHAVVRVGNTIYIGGRFTYVGPVTGGGVPLDAASGVPAGSFPKVTGNVRAVARDGGGGWYIGGQFDAVGGVARSNIAHVLADGTVSAWNPNADLPVSTLAVSGSAVYAGGDFTSIGGQPRNNIAAVDGSGFLTAWNPNASGPVYAGWR